MALVQLPQGSYRGFVKDGIHVFHGIPYADSFQRFQAPEKPRTINEEQDVTSWGAVCPQLPSRLSLVMGPMPAEMGAQDEKECGVLSIYSPAPRQKSSKPLPVIVFVHGGAFITGTSEVSVYDGRRFARDANAVVVTMNYRLGVFGFLPREGDELSPGTLDVAAAFGWVRENISHFGGDAGNVTGIGQSAGALHVQCLVDLFPDVIDKAILHSCPGTSDTSLEKRQSVRSCVEESLPDGVTLHSASTEQLLHAQGKTCQKFAGPIPPFWPNVVESKYKKSEKGKPILVCWTKDDGSVFAVLGGRNADEDGPKMTKSIFVDPSREHGQRWIRDGYDVAFYEFTWAPEGFELGAAHCIELPLLFGDEQAWKMAPMIGKTRWEEWERLGKEIRQAWGQFAKDGAKPQGLSALKSVT